MTSAASAPPARDVRHLGDFTTTPRMLLIVGLALPIGAVVGGGLGRRVPHRVVAAAGLVLATVGFLLMAAWGPESLHHLSSSAVLAVTGLGFGLGGLRDGRGAGP